MLVRMMKEIIRIPIDFLRERCDHKPATFDLSSSLQPFVTPFTFEIVKILR